jgi:hypothetical protein
MALDPKSNRVEREAEKAKKQEDPPLDPPFPHRRQSFDPFFFKLERETPDEKAERESHH